ncbi:uncharacterized protein LOC105650463 [Jatropha curcas]|uniref:uncharacterized protein LOC105650463 n=1 Tax=Jatropha curcas TaxID=180498 RepID=UPI001893D64C|nr:uncharacterized protein LOC105650463 [Jatropha curcas]
MTNSAGVSIAAHPLLDNSPIDPFPALGTRSSRGSVPRQDSKRRPTSLLSHPSSSTPVEGPSRAGPSHAAGAFRIPQAISEATRPVHPGLANLHLPYIISYYTPEGTSFLREVSLERVNRLALPPDGINEVPDGLISQMMEILGMQET